MKKHYLVPMDSPGLESVKVWVNEEGIATHNVVSGCWPVMCMGIKVNFTEKDVLETMDLSDESYEETERLLRIVNENRGKSEKTQQDADEDAYKFFHDYMDYQNKVFHRGKYSKV